MQINPQAHCSLVELENLVDSKRSISFQAAAKAKVERSSKALQKLVESPDPIYGVNTGFGRLAQIRVSESELVALQENLLRSHACGIGAPLSSRVVRRLILLRLLSLGKTYSGIQWPLLKRHLDYLNKGLTPYIPSQGSVGASGDLAPLAHLGITFLGEGYFLENSKKVSASAVLKRFSWKPIPVKAKEGLSLTNGTQFSLALALESLRSLRSILEWMEDAACLSVEAHVATSRVFLPKIHELKKHEWQLKVAKSLSKKLRGSEHMRGHRHCNRVQDSYSFRCIPQVVGPAMQLIENAEKMLEAEINSVSDNPLFFEKEKKLYSCGHFHAQAVSMACDTLAIAVATLGNLIERRIDQLVNPLTSRSMGFLANQPGVESGLMIMQTAAASLASENKTLSFPASADTISTNGNQEDHVSMAPWAARKLGMMVDNLKKLVAAEVVCAVRGCVLESTKSGQSFSPFVEKKLKELAERSPNLFLAGDRVFSEDWDQLYQYFDSL